MKVWVNRLVRAASLLEHPGALMAAMTWPKFSLANFTIVTRLAQMGVRPGTILDIGANVGQFAIAAAKRFPGAQVFCVEPDPRSVAILKSNAKDIDRISVHQTAMSDTCGVANFHVNQDSQVSSLLPLGADRIEAFPGSTVREVIEVGVETLDSLFAHRPLEAPILLKLDVQGSEDRVLLGGNRLLKSVSWITLEVAFASLYEGEADFLTVCKLLDRHGFQFTKPLNFHTRPDTGEIIEMDALFVRGDGTPRRQSS